MTSYKTRQISSMYLKTCQTFNDQLKVEHFWCETLQFPAELVTFTEEILNRKLHLMCSENLIDNCARVSGSNPFLKRLLI